MQSEDSNDLTSLVGKSLGNYRVVEHLGSGGMSTVFKAYQPTLDRYVAIKVLPAYYSHDPMFLQRFTREAQSVARLAHPNIVQIHDFGEQDAIFYIVMEYVDGGTLGGKLRQGALSVPEAADYMLQAASGLEYAHRQGIVHRDVKPANMLLRKDGHLLLSDFGIAKILEGTFDPTEATRPGTLIGTPAYVSPEQGSGQLVDNRSDIYSLGVVFFQCLSGRVPFTDDNPIALIVKHLQEALPVQHLQSANIPDPIVQVVLKMTAKNPEDRFSNAGEVIDGLTQALADSHIALPRTRSGEQEQKTGVSSDSPVVQEKPSFELSPGSTTDAGLSEQIGVIGHPPQPAAESAVPSTVLFTDAVLPQVDLKDFFVIYSRSDRAWAKWITWELENAGYATVLPAWSFQHDSDFDLEMQKAAAKAQRTVILLSPHYLKAFDSRPGVFSLFQKAVTGKQSRYLPVCVHDCREEFSWLLDSIDYIDLVGEDETNARMILLASVRGEGIKLTAPPAFPGSMQNTLDTVPGFPNRQFMTQAQFEAAEADPSTYISPLHSSLITQGVKVFFSYAHKDKKLRSELEKYLNHLKRRQLIVGWYDGEIEAGKEWAQEINQHLGEAQIILLLISQDFMASEYCYDIEMQKALVRHESGEAHVIPIILRPAMWESSPIGKLQALPTGAKPIIMWSNRELAFLDVAKGIQKAIDQLKPG